MQISSDTVTRCTDSSFGAISQLNQYQRDSPRSYNSLQRLHDVCSLSCSSHANRKRERRGPGTEFHRANVERYAAVISKRMP